MQVRAALLKKAIPGALQDMWRSLLKFDREKLDSLFANPVDKRDYPQYQEHIKEPMDLKTLGSVSIIYLSLHYEGTLRLLSSVSRYMSA